MHSGCTNPAASTFRIHQGQLEENSNSSFYYRGLRTKAVSWPAHRCDWEMSERDSCPLRWFFRRSSETVVTQRFLKTGCCLSQSMGQTVGKMSGKSLLSAMPASLLGVLANPSQHSHAAHLAARHRGRQVTKNKTYYAVFLDPCDLPRQPRKSICCICQCPSSGRRVPIDPKQLGIAMSKPFY